MLSISITSQKSRDYFYKKISIQFHYLLFHFQNNFFKSKWLLNFFNFILSLVSSIYTLYTYQILFRSWQRAKVTQFFNWKNWKNKLNYPVYFHLNMVHLNSNVTWWNWWMIWEILIIRSPTRERIETCFLWNTLSILSRSPVTLKYRWSG